MDANAFGHLAQAQAHPRLQVYQEDCIIDHQRQLHLPASPARAQKRPEKEPQIQEVYVQHLMDAERFKPVPVQRMKSAFSQVKKSSAEPQRRSFRWELLASCAAHDPDALQLQLSDNLDIDILELLANSEACQSFFAMMSLTIQALLAGLGIAAGLVAFSDELAGFSHSQLQQTLGLLHPGLACLNLVLAEFICIGNGLRFLKAVDRVRKAQSNSMDGDIASASEAALKHELTHQAGISALRLATNACFLVCCLLSTRNDVNLVYGGMSFEWSADQSMLLLKVQSLLGLVALALSASDMSDLISAARSLSPSIMTALLGDTAGLQSSVGVWPRPQ
jgi:hypothetical protein